MRLTWLLGAALITLSAAWASRPYAQYERSVLPIDPQAPTTPLLEDEQERINQSAFVVRLWNPTSPEARDRHLAVQTAPPPKPPRLQLIGITDDGWQLRAALYDPDADRLLIVTSGDHVKNHLVTVTTDAVELADGQVTHRLALRKDRS